MLIQSVLILSNPPLFIFRLFGTKCAKCGLGFSKNDFVMRAKTKIFHIDCFRCVACSRQLIPGDEFALRDDGLFCKADHDVVERASGPLCDPGSPLSNNNNNNNDSSSVNNNNKKSHSEKNGLQLAGNIFYVYFFSHIFCTYLYHLIRCYINSNLICHFGCLNIFLRWLMWSHLDSHFASYAVPVRACGHVVTPYEGWCYLKCKLYYNEIVLRWVWIIYTDSAEEIFLLFRLIL